VGSELACRRLGGSTHPFLVTESYFAPNESSSVVGPPVLASLRRATLRGASLGPSTERSTELSRSNRSHWAGSPAQTRFGSKPSLRPQTFKPVWRGSPTLGRFDSCAAPLHAAHVESNRLRPAQALRSNPTHLTFNLNLRRYPTYPRCPMSRAGITRARGQGRRATCPLGPFALWAGHMHVHLVEVDDDLTRGVRAQVERLVRDEVRAVAGGQVEAVGGVLSEMRDVTDAG
jgi:hypothetical protein